MTTAASRHAALDQALAEGRTVVIRNCLHNWKVTPATAKRWAKAGWQLFKHDDKHLYMASGKQFLIIDYCQIDVTVPATK